MEREFSDHTVKFKKKNDNPKAARNILLAVHAALQERGYNPVNQIVGYLISGDPSYITSHQNARSVIQRLERDELLEELLKAYLQTEDPTRE